MRHFVNCASAIRSRAAAAAGDTGGAIRACRKAAGASDSPDSFAAAQRSSKRRRRPAMPRRCACWRRWRRSAPDGGKTGLAPSIACSWRPSAGRSTRARSCGCSPEPPARRASCAAESQLDRLLRRPRARRAVGTAAAARVSRLRQRGRVPMGDRQAPAEAGAGDGLGRGQRRGQGRPRPQQQRRRAAAERDGRRDPDPARPHRRRHAAAGADFRSPSGHALFGRSGVQAAPRFSRSRGERACGRPGAPRPADRHLPHLSERRLSRAARRTSPGPALPIAATPETRCFSPTSPPTGCPDPLTVHAGRPPASGEKWIFSQWIRDRVPGPPPDRARQGNANRAALKMRRHERMGHCWDEDDGGAERGGAGGAARYGGWAVGAILVLAAFWFLLFATGLVTTLGSVEGSERHGASQIRARRPILVRSRHHVCEPRPAAVVGL